MNIIFKDIVKQWTDVGGWHYVRLPKDTYSDLKEIGQSGKRGFGAIKVRVAINQTEWETSIFPDNKDKSYILFIKKTIRKIENLEKGSNFTAIISVSI